MKRCGVDLTPEGNDDKIHGPSTGNCELVINKDERLSQTQGDYLPVGAM
jgi:hypothetical protein